MRYGRTCGGLQPALRAGLLMVVNARTYLLLALFSIQLHAAEYGLISLNQGDGNYLYTTYKINKGEIISAQIPNSSGTATCCKKFQVNIHPIKPTNIPVSDTLTNRVIYVYQIKQLKNIGDSLPFIGIATIGLSVNMKQTSQDSVKVMDKKKVSVMRYCLSNEGLHLTATENSKINTKLYFHFDYEVQNPTCSTKNKQ